jgi:tetratricopeptide (TPR) repeat protein
LAPKKLDARIAKGNVLLDEARYTDAEALADEILGLEPASVDGHIIKGVARLYGDSLEQALDSFTLALQTQPDEHVALLHRGIIHLRLGRTEAAVSDLKAALKNHPDCDEVFYNLAIAYVTLGEREAAIDALQTAIEIHPPRRADAQTAKEFEALRSEPRFRAVLARQGRARQEPGRASDHR